MDYHHLPLGKTTAYSAQYDPSLLAGVPRAQTRDFWPAATPLPFCGSDHWTAYEVSWLNPRGKPVVACLTLQYDALSAQIVESKSLKLYLNSFNQTAFHDADSVRTTIARDLAGIVHAAVQVELLDGLLPAPLQLAPWRDTCIDDLDIAIDCYTPDPQLLATERHTVEDTLVSHLLRSNCPVTGQPDWASVRIHYHGPRITPDSLLRYICSYRAHQGFHEQCIERMFCDLWQQCQPQRLAVEGRFTRRGGLDINPFRSSDARWHASHHRQVRQ